MPREPKEIRLITASAAAHVFGISTARLRQLANAGKLDFRLLRWGGRPARVFFWNELAARWGDPDDVSWTTSVYSYQMTSRGSCIWEVVMLKPSIVPVDDPDGLAIE